MTKSPKNPKTHNVWLVQEADDGTHRTTLVGTAIERKSGTFAVRINSAPLPGSKVFVSDGAVSDGGVGDGAAPPQDCSSYVAKE